MAAARLLPVAAINSVSEVEVSLSTVMQLKVWSVSRTSIFCKTGWATAASVKI